MERLCRVYKLIDLLLCRRIEVAVVRSIKGSIFSNSVGERIKTDISKRVQRGQGGRGKYYKSV